MKKRSLILAVLAVLIAFAMCACGDMYDNLEPPADAMVSYESADAGVEVTYTDGYAILVLKVDKENELVWKCEIEDEASLKVKQEYILKPTEPKKENIYHIWVFEGLQECEEVQAHVYKTDKDGNTGFNGERIFAFEVSEDLTVSMVWGRLVVKS